MKYTILALLLFVLRADAAPFEIVAHQSAGYRITGTITLREPVTDRLLGTYEFVTGGFGRGSAPFGKYVIDAFRDDGWIGPRWEIHTPGFHPRRGFSAFDRRIRKVRTWLQLHSMHGMNKGTFGCIGVFGGEKVWAEFIGHIRFLQSWVGQISFDFEPVGSATLAAK